MKKIIIAAFAVSMLGATAAQALSIGINTGHHHHRHQVCSWHHHHRVCHWR